MVVTFPLLTVIDDSGTVVSGATVTITSVKDKVGSDIASPGATIRQSGANVGVDYDAEAKGEAWIVLAISKGGSTFTGLNAAPAFYLSTDPSRLALMYAGWLEMGIVPCSGTVTSASGTTVVVDITTDAPAVLSTLIGQVLYLASGDRPAITAASGTTSAATLTVDAAPATTPAGGSAFTIF